MKEERIAIPGTAARIRRGGGGGCPAALAPHRPRMSSAMCWSGMSRYLQTAGSLAITSSRSSVTDDG
jgi:hypothetical protein